MPDGINLSQQIASKRWDANDLRRRIAEAMAKNPHDGATVDRLLDDLEKSAAELRTLEHKEAEAMRRARPIIGTPGAVVREPGAPQITSDTIVRSLVVAVESHVLHRRAGDVLRARYGEGDEAERILRTMSLTVPVVAKAAQAPATTFTPGYAAELVRTTYAAWLDLMRSEAIFAQIAWNGATFDDGKVIYPMRDDAPAYPANLEAMWRKEGDPIRVGRLTTKAVELAPFSAGIIGTYTKELFARSTPNIETVLRQGIVEDSAEAFDAYLFSATAGVADVRPPGLLVGLPAGDTRASSGSTYAQIDGDLMGMIKAAVTLKRGRRFWWVMSEANRIALASKLNTTSDVAPYRAGLIGARRTLLDIPVASSLTFPNDRVYLLDGEAIAFAGGTPTWEVSDQATLHEESETPAPISGAAPVRSLFQTHSAAVKAVYELSWQALRSRPIQELTAVAW